MLISPEFYQSATYFGCFIAAILNLILVPHSILKSKYSLGSFKIIMIVFSSVNMLHYFVDTFSLPRFYTSRKLSIVYVSGKAKDWGDFWGTFCGVWLCNIFMLQVFIEALHFLYRYVLLCKERLQFLLTSRNIIIILCVTLPTYILLQTLNFLLMMPFDEDVWDALENDTSYSMAIEPRDLHGIAMLYSKKFNNGEEITRWNSIFGVVLLLSCNAILLSSMLITGYKIHHKIKEFKTPASRKTNEMHKTLFQMLVVQTVAPLILLHTPCAVLLIGPFFFSFHSGADLMMLTILIYPVFEPLIVLFFLNRQFLIRFWNVLKKTHRVHSNSVNPSSVYTSEQ